MPSPRRQAIIIWAKSWQTPCRRANASAGGVSTVVASGSKIMSRCSAKASASAISKTVLRPAVTSRA
jgi:hypothetical protein